MVYDKVKSSSNKKRVSFALPEGKHEHHLRLKSPAARPANVDGCNSGKRNHETNETVVPPSHHNRRHKSTVQKCFVRDTEMPVSSSTKKVWPARTVIRPPTRRGSILKNPLHPMQNVLTNEPLDNQGYTSKYSAPELYSSLSVAQKIKSAAEDYKNQISITDVPLFIKQQIEGKAFSKHNIPFEDQIFHDLVTLNVSGDKEILSRDEEKSVLEDLEPSLADFHQPKFGEEYRYDYKPQPCHVEKVRRYNGLSVYNKMQGWENRT